MNDGYKEVLLREQRPSPWQMRSLPKFTEVPGRKFNSCPNAKSDDGEPPTPPPSPIGTFKYPALLRGRNSWPMDAIVTEVRKGTNLDAADPSDVKPKSRYCPKLDLSSLTQADPAISFKASTRKVEGSAKFSDNSTPKKSTDIPEAGDVQRDASASSMMTLNQLGNGIGAMSTEDFHVILKHALSRDPITAKQNSTPRIRKSMTFSERTKTVFPIKKRQPTKSHFSTREIVEESEF